MSKKGKDESNEEVSFIDITRSFSRKLNMAAHGGKQYETADIFCSITAKVPASDVKITSKQLDTLCQMEVNKTIAEFDGGEDEEEEEEAPKKKKAAKKVEEEEEEEDDEEEEEEAPKKKKSKKVEEEEDEDEDEEEDEDEDEEEEPVKKQKFDLGVKLDQDELEEIQEYINDLTMAKTPIELKKAAMKIKDAASDLTAIERKYLNAYYTKRKEAIEAN